MAILNDSECLANEINTSNPRENCDFLCSLDYTLNLYNEEVTSFSIVAGELPQDVELNSSSGTLSGNVISPDDWDTDISKYILNAYAILPDSDCPFDDIPELTVGELKSLDGLHVSGVNYGITGIKAYYRDNFSGGPLSQFNFTIRLTTTYEDELLLGVKYTSTVDKDFYIMVVPNTDPESFLLSYGEANNNFVNDDNQLLTPQEYIDWRKSQGHTFPSGCN